MWGGSWEEEEGDWTRRDEEDIFASLADVLDDSEAAMDIVVDESEEVETQRVFRPLCETFPTAGP